MNIRRLYPLLVLQNSEDVLPKPAMDIQTFFRLYCHCDAYRTVVMGTSLKLFGLHGGTEHCGRQSWPSLNQLYLQPMPVLFYLSCLFGFTLRHLAERVPTRSCDEFNDGTKLTRILIYYNYNLILYETQKHQCLAEDL